jgi:hypothetical protein
MEEPETGSRAITGYFSLWLKQPIEKVRRYYYAIQ